MGFSHEWLSDEQTVMCYRAEGLWNWNDYHTCVRASLFSLHRHPRRVHSLIDLRGGTRPTPPGGLGTHMRTFGKRVTPVLSGYAVVVGLPPAWAEGLVLSADGTLPTPDGAVALAQDEADALAWLATH